MIWYLLICSMIGGLSVSVTTGLGSAIVTSVKGDNQVCVLSFMKSIHKSNFASHSLSIGSLISCSALLLSPCVSHFANPPIRTRHECFPVTEIYYLNVALALFNTGEFRILGDLLQTTDRFCSDG